MVFFIGVVYVSVCGVGEIVCIVSGVNIVSNRVQVGLEFVGIVFSFEVHVLYVILCVSSEFVIFNFEMLGEIGCLDILSNFCVVVVSLNGWLMIVGCFGYVICLDVFEVNGIFVNDGGQIRMF